MQTFQPSRLASKLAALRIILCSTFLAGSFAGGHPSTTTSEPIAACMAQAATRLAFNGTVYARIGGVPVQRSFGTSDATQSVPISSDTLFNIASAGKMLTAVAIGRLVDRGSVDFEAPISRYLDALPADVGAVTVAQLLNHTAGLGNYFDPRNGTAIANARTATDLLPLALQDRLAFTPGSRRVYSNSGFVVLGAIIEKVAGTSYADFVRREILDPLAMTHTQFDALEAAVPLSRMTPDGMSTQARPVPGVFLRSSPAGGIYSTAPDLAKFLHALGSGRLLRRETLAAMVLPRTDPGGTAGFYGYGFNVRIEVPRRVGHGGGAPGINAEIALYPESGNQLIALSNNDPPAATRMVSVLEKVMFSPKPLSACGLELDSGH